MRTPVPSQIADLPEQKPCPMWVLLYTLDWLADDSLDTAPCRPAAKDQAVEVELESVPV